MEYVFTKDIEAQKRFTINKKYIVLFFLNKEYLDFNREKEKIPNPLCLLFSTSPVLHRSYFSAEPARSEMLSPYSCTYPLPGFMLNASLSRI